MGTPADAAAMTAKAKEMLVSLNKEQENQLKWVEGFQRYMRGEKEPAKEGPVKRGWNDARIAVEGKVPAH
jgi:thiamine monophosphate kinase